MAVTTVEHWAGLRSWWGRHAPRTASRSHHAEVPVAPDGLAADAAADGSTLARGMLLGAVIGTVIVTVGLTVAALVNGADLGGALGLGLFVGMWGGAGSGFMMGATVTLARHPEIAEGASSHPIRPGGAPR